MGKFAKGHPGYLKPDPAKSHVVVCPCGISIYCRIITSHGVRKFCSRECHTKYRNRNWKRGSLSEDTKRKIGEANKKVYAENPERTSAWKGGISKVPGYKTNNRRKLRLKTVGSHTLTEWLELKVKYNLTCPSCTKTEPNIKLTQDHIVPLIKGGSDYIDNIQPLCGLCNSKKSRQIVKYPILELV